MGRPLYSRAFNSTPAVRDPEPACEKWSYLNAFDPDSDEFFDSENAVYEDFIDPAAPTHLGEEDDEEQGMLVVRMGDASPIASENSSLSDNESPLAAAVAAENTARPIADAVRDAMRTTQDDSEPALVVPTRHIRIAGRHPSEVAVSPRRYVPRTPVRNVPYHPYSQRDELPVPAPSSPIPVPMRRSTAEERVLLSPSTPPRQTPMAHFAMSPPPTSTPRLYSWARNPSRATSPSSGSPFTNPHARTSYTHLSPVLIRIRDVTV